MSTLKRYELGMMTVNKIMEDRIKELEDMLRRWDKYHRMFDGKGNLAALHSETYALLNKGE